LSTQDAGQQLKIVLKDWTKHVMRSNVRNSDIIATASSGSSPSTEGKSGMRRILGSIPSAI
jgi:hypothetical protein